MAERGRSFYAENLSFDRGIAQILAVLRRVTARPSPS